MTVNYVTSSLKTPLAHSLECTCHFTVTCNCLLRRRRLIMHRLGTWRLGVCLPGWGIRPRPAGCWAPVAMAMQKTLRRITACQLLLRIQLASEVMPGTGHYLPPHAPPGIGDSPLRRREMRGGCYPMWPIAMHIIYAIRIHVHMHMGYGYGYGYGYAGGADAGWRRGDAAVRSRTGRKAGLHS